MVMSGGADRVTLSINEYKNNCNDATALQTAFDDIKHRQTEEKNTAYSLVLENKRYYIDRTLKIEDLTDVVIDGSGATIVVTECVAAFDILNCNSVTLKSLSVDYDPLYYTQGSVIAINGNTFSIEIDAGYRDDYENFLLKKRFAVMTVHDPVTGGVKDGATEDYEVKELSRPRPGVIDATLSIPYTGPSEYRPQMGDKIALYLCITGVFGIYNCANTVFDTVSILAAAGFGIHEKSGKGGTVLKNCRIVPGPAPKGATEKRILSTLGDATHFQAVEKGPTVEECVFTNCCDDCINAHGFFFRVSQLDGEYIYLSIIGDERWAVGDTVNCFAKGTYEKRGSAKIIEFERIEGFTISEKNAAILGNTGYSKTAYRIRLDKPIAGLSVGDDMTDTNRISSGAVVRNSTFGYNRARGIVLKGHNCIVENNSISGCTNSGIMIISELSWAEAGFPENTVVRNNTVTHTCHSSRTRNGGGATVGAIMVLLDSAKGDFFHCSELRNITVESNTVNQSGAYGIFVGNCNGITIRNNRVERPFDRGINRIASNYGIIPKSGIVIGMSQNIIAESNITKSDCGDISQSVEILPNCSQIKAEGENIICQ